MEMKINLISNKMKIPSETMKYITFGFFWGINF